MPKFFIQHLALDLKYFKLIIIYKKVDILLIFIRNLFVINYYYPNYLCKLFMQSWAYIHIYKKNSM